MSLETGELLDGKYRIIRLIGEGGMGAVYEGENIRINRRVAIKVLHAALTTNAEVTQRFEREAQAAGRIGNDHILEVIDLGVLPNGDRFIVMEFLDGEPLSARISQRKRLTPQELAPLVRQVLVGLGAAHRAGIVHRDLKPDNIYVLKSKAGRTDFVKIIDFGISKFQPLAGDGMKMTRTGAVMGTPYYMSPEQASGSAEADQRSDLYSIGVIMFEAVTGQVPFEAGTFNQLMFKIVLAEVPQPTTIVPDLDPAFTSLIARGMARDVAQRFQSADEFIQALDAWVQRGAAVSVPPPTDVAASGLLPASGPMTSAAATSAGVRSGGKTAGTWATTNDDAVPLKKGPGAGVVLGLIGALIVVGGGAAFALLGHSKEEPVVANSAAPEPPPAAPRADPAAPSPTPPEPKVEPVAAPAAPARPPEAPSASAAPSAAAVPRVAPRPAPRHTAVKPVPKPPKPAPARPSQKPGGTPDFGY